MLVWETYKQWCEQRRQRSQAIRATVESVMQSLAGRLFPVTAIEAAVIVRRDLREQGVTVSLEEACEAIEVYEKRRLRQVQKFQRSQKKL